MYMYVCDYPCDDNGRSGTHSKHAKTRHFQTNENNTFVKFGRIKIRPQS